MNKNVNWNSIRKELKEEFIYFPFFKGNSIYKSQEKYEAYVDKIVTNRDAISILDLSCNNEIIKDTSNNLLTELHKLFTEEQEI